MISLKFLILGLFLYIVLSVITMKQSYTIKDMQTAFNDNFCKCNINTCFLNRQYLKTLGKLNHFSYDPTWIIKNRYKIRGMQVKKYSLFNRIPISSGIYESFISTVIFTPQDSMEPMKGWVVYNHPTVFGKFSKPSQLLDQYIAIASIYVSNNYAVLMNDFSGLGEEDPFPQGYLIYPSSCVCPLINFLNYDEFQNVYGKLQNFNRLYIVGYSEGASVTYSFAKQVYQTKSSLCYTTLKQRFQIERLAGLDGPYDISNTVKNYLLDDVKLNDYYRIQNQLQTNLGKPPLIIQTLKSFIYFEEYNKKLQQVVSHSFYLMQCHFQDKNICKIDKARYNLDSALSLNKKSSSIAKAIGFSSFGSSIDSRQPYVRPDFSSKSSQNSILRIISKQILSSQKFNNILVKASIIDFQCPYPSFLFSLNKDSLVSPVNSQKFSYNKQYVTLSNEQFKVCNDGIEANVDHLGGEIISNLFALSYFERSLGRNDDL